MKYYLLKDRKWFCLTCAVKSIASFFSVFLAITVKKLMDAGVDRDKNAFYQAIVFSIITVAFSFLIKCFLSKSNAVYLKNTLSALKKDVLKRVTKKNVSMMTKEDTSKYISILTNDIMILENNYFNNYLSVIGNIVQAVVAGVSVVILQPAMAPIAIVLSFVPMIAPAVMGEKLAKVQGRYSASLEKYTGKLKEILGGFEVMKSFHVEANIEKIFNSTVDQVGNTKRKTDETSGYLGSISETIAYGVFLLRDLIGVLFVLGGKMTIGTLVAVDNLSSNLANPLMATATMIGEIKGTKEIRDKIMAILNEPEPANGQLSLPENLDGKIEVRDVTFSYDGSKNILDHVSYTFEKGKKYALVGNSGCGKSTLLKLMMQYYDTYTGSIYYDGTELKEAEKSSLYQTMSMIHQNIFLYNDTIENNITLYNDYPQQEIQRAIQESGLEKVVSALPEGVQTIVNENGNNFSGGEKQRIAIARVFLRKTPVLLLDEATSSLDNETSYAIESLLLSKKDITGIVITHKLNENILKQYDQIIALDKGKICECGTFDELIQKQGYFYNLYHVFDSAESVGA